MVKGEGRSATYKAAGVDIDLGNRFVAGIKQYASLTQRPEVVGHLGGFAALCELPKQYQEPILVSATDGVGTKLKLAIELNIHDSIGIDLVAMCANDIIVCGAEPLQFMDYFATAQLQLPIAEEVIKGIAEGCRQAGCALVGGETAEMPGMYALGDYDLAGFCQGVVEKSKLITGAAIASDDQLIGLPSSGLHSNGYSLVRQLLATSGIDIKTEEVGGISLSKQLLEPTKIYVKPILSLCQQVQVKAMAHITGGGLLENIPRILPKGYSAVIDDSRWQRPAIFNWLAQQGAIQEAEMYRTFNCGIGMLVAVAKKDLNQAMELLSTMGQDPIHIGHIARSTEGSANVLIKSLEAAHQQPAPAKESYLQA